MARGLLLGKKKSQTAPRLDTAEVGDGGRGLRLPFRPTERLRASVPSPRAGKPTSVARSVRHPGVVSAAVSDGTEEQGKKLSEGEGRATDGQRAAYPRHRSSARRNEMKSSVSRVPPSRN